MTTKTESLALVVFDKYLVAYLFDTCYLWGFKDFPLVCKVWNEAWKRYFMIEDVDVNNKLLK
jgi:hypothetical protein